MAHETAIISGAGIITGLIVGVYVWVGKHASKKNRHPCTDSLVYKDVCEERGKTNEMAHQYLKEGIEQAIKRSDERHIEIKEDLTEIKELIKNGH